MDLMLVNISIQVIGVILAPILIAYALFAYRGQYESRSLPGLIAIALLLGASKIFGVWLDLTNRENFLLEIAQNLCVLASILVLFFMLRGYIHSEIDLRNNKKIQPRQEMRRKKQAK